jgi:hypothetical protein
MGHGSNSGYVVHYRRGEKPCDPCIEAHRAYQKAYSAARHVALQRLVASHRGEYDAQLQVALAEAAVE